MYPSADGDNTPSGNIMDVQQLFDAITLIWTQNCCRKVYLIKCQFLKKKHSIATINQSTKHVPLGKSFEWTVTIKNGFSLLNNTKTFRQIYEIKAFIKPFWLKCTDPWLTLFSFLSLFARRNALTWIRTCLSISLIHAWSTNVLRTSPYCSGKHAKHPEQNKHALCSLCPSC